MKKGEYNNYPRKFIRLLILRRNCFLHDVIKGQVTEVKVVGRRRTQILYDLRNRRRYWELKEEAEDKNRWKRQFINRT